MCIRDSPSNSLFQHEYGHYLQSQKYGLLYYPEFGLPSLTSARNHDYYPTEQDANARAYEYFNRNVNGYSRWDFIRNPIVDFNYRMGGIGSGWVRVLLNTIDRL